MTITQKRINKELMEIINKFDLTGRIPEKVIDNIKNNQDENWGYVYDDNLELDEQKISKETAIMFSAIYIMYICDDEKEKEELKKIYIKNEEEIKKQLNNTDIFEEKLNKKQRTEEVSLELPIVQEEKNSIFVKEDEAKKEAQTIAEKSKGEVKALKDKAMANVDEAASIIVKNIL